MELHLQVHFLRSSDRSFGSMVNAITSSIALSESGGGHLVKQDGGYNKYILRRVQAIDFCRVLRLSLARYLSFNWVNPDYSQ